MGVPGIHFGLGEGNFLTAGHTTGNFGAPDPRYLYLGVCEVLKKAGIVAGAAAGLMMIGGTAFASPADHGYTPDPTFGDAYATFIEGGGALGFGAASLVAGAYTGIATTPALVLHSLEHHG
jgi:hypothetical protein